MGRTIPVVVATVALAAGLVACGGGGSSSPDPATTYKNCSYVAGPTLQKMEALDTRLDVGLNQSDYGNAVGNVAVAVQQITSREKGHLAGIGACRSKVLSEFDLALNNFETANSVWNHCISHLGCRVQGATLARIRSFWNAAAGEVGVAKRGLASLRS